MSDLRKQATKADRQAFQRLLSGVSYHKGSKVRFMTLTYPAPVTPQEAKRTFKEFFKELRKNYDVEYFQTHTLEGNGSVHHLALTGDYLPIQEIRQMWIKRTGGSQIDLQLVKKFRAFYLEMTRQQKTSRYSQSRGWTWSGARADWKNITRRHTSWNSEDSSWHFEKKTAIRRWQELIREKREVLEVLQQLPRVQAPRRLHRRSRDPRTIRPGASLDAPGLSTQERTAFPLEP